MMRKESGQSLIVVALLMVLLFGFAAVAVDIGSEVLDSIELHRVVNAAALAGAQKMGEGADLATVTQQVYAYVTANGVSSSNVSRINIDNGTVEVVLTVPDYFFFAPVLGFRSVIINRSATAGTALPGVFDYAIFAGDTSNPGDTGSALYVNVNHVKVTGNIHSNNGIYVNANNGNGGDNSITGIVDTAGTANISSNVSVAAGVLNQGQVLSMPDLSSQVEQQAESEKQVYADGWNNETNISISGTVWVQGSVTIYTNNVKGAGCVFANGNIDVYANNTTGGDADMAYYSKDGNITIHTNNITVNGVFYAPNGTISIEPEYQNTGTTIVNGSLVAKDINLNSNQLDVESTNGSNSLMPKIAYLVS